MRGDTQPLCIFLLLFSVSAALDISLNYSDDIKFSPQNTVINFVDFMYPYEIFEIRKEGIASSEYLFAKIDSFFATDDSTAGLL